jgi:hypothetical protein
MAKVLGFNSISAIEFLDNAAANKILWTNSKDLLNATIFDEKGAVLPPIRKQVPPWLSVPYSTEDQKTSCIQMKIFSSITK